MEKQPGVAPDWKTEFPYSTTEALQVTRRQFAKFLCLMSGGLAAGSAMVAVKSAFFPERKVEGEHFVCNKSELPVGGTKAFFISGSTIPYILIHLESGELKAYEQKCTHLSCAVYYVPGTNKIMCPCHNGWFDATNGDAIQGPPPRPLPSLKVVMKGEAVYVTAG